MTNEEYEQIKQNLQNENLEQFPSIFQQARNLAKQAWISGNGVLQGKPLLTTSEKAFARLEICNTCEFFKDTRCTRCGCYMEKKVHLELAQCPANKWGDLQYPIQPNKKNASENFLIDLNQFSDTDKIEVLALAEDSITNFDGRFTFKKKQFFSKKNENGVISIFLIPPVPKQGPVPEKNCRLSLSDFTIDENKIIIDMAQASFAAGNTSFEYKNLSFTITPSDNVVGYTVGISPQ